MSAKNTYEIPLLEDERLAELHRYQVLDTPPEQAFDDLAFLAGTICGTPVALITFVDADRQWFKARIGLNTSETSRDAAFCARTILGRELMVVTDTHRDARFRDNPLVTGTPYIRFYAGAPLRTADELALGSLCVIDYVPRVLSEEQRLALKSLGRLVVLQLEARRQALYAREPHANGTQPG